MYKETQPTQNYNVCVSEYISPHKTNMVQVLSGSFEWVLMLDQKGTAVIIKYTTEDVISLGCVAVVSGNQMQIRIPCISACNKTEHSTAR